jgi:hypothetical protein
MRYQNVCACACLLLCLSLYVQPANAQPSVNKITYSPQAADTIAGNPANTASATQIANPQLAQIANPQLSGKYAQTVDQKVARFNSQAENYTRHTLDNMIDEEKKMQRRMARSDSSLSKKLFAYSIDSLQKLKAAISTTSSKVTRLINGSYFPYADTLRQSLAFLQHASGIAGQTATMSSQLTSSLQQVDAMEGKLNTISTIQTYIQQRQQVLSDALGKLPQYAGSLQQLNKTAYYYSAQIAEYKSTLKDPAKIERKVLDLVEQSPAFQKLMQNNGQLAGLFAPRLSFASLPVSGNIPIVNGLPSRAMLQQYMQANVPAVNGANPLSQIQQQAPDAGSQLQQTLNKLNPAGNQGGSNPAGATAGFTPNTQKTRSFGQRLEWGFDFQFGQAVNYLPATANIGVKLGYKLNDRFSAGVGAGYLVGMGTGWKDIRISSQGIGLRSYLKWQVKKGWDIQGGTEFNYLTAFNSIAQLRQFQAWQTSALLGISKQYKVSQKVKGNFQVLYDFLYRQHIPNSQPILFRLGYDL